MKLYEATEKVGNTTYIGLVLTKNSNECVMDKIFCTNRENAAYLSGIEMAVSYMHNHNATEDLTVYNSQLTPYDQLNSEYIDRMMPHKRISVNTEELTLADKTLLQWVVAKAKNAAGPAALKNLSKNFDR